MNPFTLKVKGRSSIGLVSLSSIPGVPFIVGFVVMSMVLTVVYYGVHFNVLDNTFYIWLRMEEEAVWPLLFITLGFLQKSYGSCINMIG